MECNKEAAIQARELAESKLLLKDYKAAQKFCVKAQSLFPNLENLTQLLTVCSVHCSAEHKINNETDWYGVLQVGTTADELAIKKQYRKLALLLHPDKNKFPGAESAFKLIGEANTILTDRGKRSLHDLKRSGRNNNNAQIRRPSQAARQTGQTGQASQQTFWTICTTCGMRYQHFRNVYRRALRCQNCMQTFVAYDINEQPVQTQNPNNRNPNPSPMYSFNRPNGSATAGNSNPFQRPSPIFTQFQPGAGTSTGTAESMKFEKVNLEKGANAKPSPAGASFANKPPVNPPKSNPPKRTQPQKKKRKRVVEEDEEEEESEADSSESEEEIVLEKEVKMNGTNDPPRRSSRRKNDVKYNEKDNIDEDLEDVLEHDDVSDDDDDDDDAEVDFVDDDVTVTYARKRLRKESDRDKHKRSVPNEKEKDIKMNDKEQEKEKETEIKTKEKEKGKAKQTEESESESESEPKEFVYSEPEFFNFDGLRACTRFAADQVWAAYDSLDGMPRFYALIKTVRHAPAFHLKFTWLESDPSSRSAAAWTRADLPVACGSFVTGSVETTDELLMFSHMVDYSKGARGKRGGFEIYPKKGEIWAVFKDWDENWSADPEAHGHESFEYEIVEVLSDLGESTGFVVTRLVRLSGFVSVFVRESEKAPFVVPTTEILRFSHRVPAYRMSGEEREKVPLGAFELDQASLPCDLDRAFGSVELDLKRKEKVSNGEKREKSNGSLSNGKSKEKVDENLDGNLEKKMNETLDGKSNGNSKEKLNGSLHNGKSKEKLGEKLDRKSKAKPSENPDKKSRDKPNEKTDENSISDSVRTNENSNTESPEYTYSEAEFYNFAIDRAIHKFQAGQVWALYSDVDQFPKFYGWVKRVDPLHEKIHIRWLEPIADGLSGEAKRWVDQELPIGCGSFEITGSTVSFYNSAFSHLVNVRNCTAGGKRRYEILPRKDEIWAIYRNWMIGWKLEDIKDSCQYEVVQVAEANEKGIKVEILKKVDGHSAVFARDRARKGMLVPKGEYVRFSHRIPSYRLGEEENGKLRGCFELDSASVPEDLL